MSRRAFGSWRSLFILLGIAGLAFTSIWISRNVIAQDAPTLDAHLAASPQGSIYAQRPLVLDHFYYLPLVAANVGHDPCLAISALPKQIYSKSAVDAYDFYSLNVPTTSTINLTVTNFVATGQFQLRSPLIDSSCSPTSSTSMQLFAGMPPSTQSLVRGNVPPGRYYARLSVSSNPSPTPYYFFWSYSPGTIFSPYEPNNNPCQAATPGNNPFQAYPDDNEDWFQFSIPLQASVQVSLTNYVGLGVMELWKQGNPCSAPTFITSVNAVPGGVLLSSSPQAAGTYLLRIYTASGYSVSQLYNVLYYYKTQMTAAPQSDACSVSGTCNQKASDIPKSQPTPMP